MRWKIRWTAEKVFLISGLLIILLGWVSDLIGALNSSAPTAHGSGDLLDRIWFTFFGLLFVAGGVVYEQHWRLLNDPVLTERYMISFLFVADGAFHLYALTDHLGELFPVVFFGVSAVVQIGLGVAIPRLDREWDPYLLAIPILFIAAYVLTRTMAVWPINTIEEVEIFGIVSKLTEGLTVLVLVAEMREAKKLEGTPAKSPPGSPETH
jgi:hypothetical protein